VHGMLPRRRSLKHVYDRSLAPRPISHHSKTWVLVRANMAHARFLPIAFSRIERANSFRDPSVILTTVSRGKE
jgi:hypothetical protein